MSTLLSVENVSVQFGGVKALTDVSFEVEKGEFLSLIGPNGAGKTTMLRVIIGIVKPVTAKIVLSGKDISGKPIHKRAEMGLSMTHQIVKPFRSMTVLDNVVLAAGNNKFRNPLSAMISFKRSEERKKALEILSLLGIEEHAQKSVVGQPLGVLKRLEVARALALKPNLLLLDEPLAGLNHVEAGKLAETLMKINASGMTIFMIEHNLGEVLRVSRRLLVLDNGVKIGDGVPEDVMRDPRIRSAYIGKETEHA